ncbi:MAG: hypothetical protein M3162_05940 [Thermoproteota archaeon]|nr:hypothetical protein [Thermoproteota archaeon]
MGILDTGNYLFIGSTATQSQTRYHEPILINVSSTMELDIFLYISISFGADTFESSFISIQEMIPHDKAR